MTHRRDPTLLEPRPADGDAVEPRLPRSRIGESRFVVRRPGPIDLARRHAEVRRSPYSVRLGRWLFRNRTMTFAPLAIAAAAAAWIRASGAAEPGMALGANVLAGFALLLAAAIVRLHVAGRARPGTSSRGVTLEAGELITTGMYAWTRNPLYVANLLIWFGLGLAAGCPIAALCMTGLAAAQYHAIILAEEEYLARRYGERYAAYCRRVPRWLAGLALARRRCPRPSAPGFTWRRALFREADTLLLLVLGAWAILGLSCGWLPWRAAAAAPRAWLLAPAGPAMAWLLVKALKKGGWKRRRGQGRDCPARGPG